MAKITLSNLRHSYLSAPSGPQDYALKEIDLHWQDGGAYALLGPSGCGKSTLATELARRLSAQRRKTIVVPMDGFHLDNAILETRGLTQRKEIGRAHV